MGSKVGKILEFIPKQPAKYGYEKVRKRKKSPGNTREQLNLFSGAAQVLRLPSNLTPFEEALLLDERNDDRAEETYRRAIGEGDSVADSYCNLGILVSKAGKTAKAFDCFTKSLEHNPRHFESHFNLGNLYFDEGNLRLARMHYECAAEVESECASVWFNLGLVAAMSNNLEAAVASLLKYRKLATTEEGHKADDLLEKLQRSLSAK